eukprot:scaffold7368_cov143-Isochrysis_galbana.AAC.3
MLLTVRCSRRFGVGLAARPGSSAGLRAEEYERREAREAAARLAHAQRPSHARSTRRTCAARGRARSRSLAAILFPKIDLDGLCRKS